MCLKQQSKVVLEFSFLPEQLLQDKDDVCGLEGERKYSGNKNSSFRFFEPFFSDCDPLFAGFETLIEMVWVWEEVILAQEVRQMVLANGTAGSCSVVQHSGGG